MNKFCFELLTGIRDEELCIRYDNPQQPLLIRNLKEICKLIYDKSFYINRLPEFRTFLNRLVFLWDNYPIELIEYYCKLNFDFTIPPSFSLSLDGYDYEYFIYSFNKFVIKFMEKAIVQEYLRDNDIYTIFSEFKKTKTTINGIEHFLAKLILRTMKNTE